MANDKDQFGDEEEYQFTDDTTDTAVDYSTESAQLPSPGSSNLRRFGLFGVGLVIVAFAVYKMLGVFSTSSTKITSPGQPSITQAPTTQPIEPTPIVEAPQPTSFPQPVSPPAGPETSELKRQLTALELESRNNRAEVLRVNNNLNDVNKSLSTVNDKLTTLSETLERMSNDMMEQRNQIMRMKRARKKAMRPPRVVRPRNVYHIKAVIPGRAWLMNTAGDTLTVREGSFIPGYGRVQMIDPHQGLVKLHGGGVIRFAHDET